MDEIPIISYLVRRLQVVELVGSDVNLRLSTYHSASASMFVGCPHFYQRWSFEMKVLCLVVCREHTVVSHGCPRYKSLKDTKIKRVAQPKTETSHQ